MRSSKLQISILTITMLLIDLVFLIAQSRSAQAQALPPNHLTTRYVERGSFQIALPDNWQVLELQSFAIFAPGKICAECRGTREISRGVIVGTANIPARGLRQATQTYVNAFLRMKNHLSVIETYRVGRIGGSASLSLKLTGYSPATRSYEIVTIHTALLNSGKLFYVTNISTGNEEHLYEPVFAAIVNSIVINQ